MLFKKFVKNNSKIYSIDLFYINRYTLSNLNKKIFKFIKLYNDLIEIYKVRKSNPELYSINNKNFKVFIKKNNILKDFHYARFCNMFHYNSLLNYSGFDKLDYLSIIEIIWNKLK